MIHPAWLFTLAAVIAVLGILTSFRKLMTTIQYRIDHDELNQESLQKEQSHYFIRVAIIEAIPIVLIIIGFMQIGEITNQTMDIILPIIIILGLLIFAITNAFIARNDLVSSVKNSKFKKYINSLFFIGIATICGIPIVSLIGIFI